VSFSVIGAIVTGLMGITVDPVSPFQAEVEGGFVDRIVRTLPQLGAIAWAELGNLPIRDNRVAVRHEGGRKTELTNQSTVIDLTWQAAFEGTHQTLLVNGRPTRGPDRELAARTCHFVRQSSCRRGGSGDRGNPKVTGTGPTLTGLRRRSDSVRVYPAATLPRHRYMCSCATAGVSCRPCED
jgi:hypothetical protein